MEYHSVISIQNPNKRKGVENKSVHVGLIKLKHH